MANDYKRSPIVLDTFTSAINLNTTYGFTGGYLINFIEWQEPTTIGHTATITDGTRDIFNETCVTANQSIIKYFDGMMVDNITIAESGVQSGKIVIGLM